MARKDAEEAFEEAREASAPIKAAVARAGDAGLMDFLTNRELVPSDDSAVTYRRIIEQIMSLETAEEILTPIEATDAKEVIGRKLKLWGFALNKSEFEVGSPFYASMDVTDTATGNKGVVNTGHQAMIAQLMKLDSLGQYPYQVEVYEAGRPNANGGIPLRLKGWS